MEYAVTDLPEPDSPTMPEHLALVKEEGHAVDGLDLARVGEKGGMEILYFK